MHMLSSGGRRCRCAGCHSLQRGPDAEARGKVHDTFGEGSGSNISHSNSNNCNLASDFAGHGRIFTRTCTVQEFREGDRCSAAIGPLISVDGSLSQVQVYCSAVKQLGDGDILPPPDGFFSQSDMSQLWRELARSRQGLGPQAAQARDLWTKIEARKRGQATSVFAR